MRNKLRTRLALAIRIVDAVPVGCHVQILVAGRCCKQVSYDAISCAETARSTEVDQEHAALRRTVHSGADAGCVGAVQVEQQT